MLAIAAGELARDVRIDEAIAKQSAPATYQRLRFSFLQVIQIQECSCNIGTLCVVAMEPVCECSGEDSTAVNTWRQEQLWMRAADVHTSNRPGLLLSPCKLLPKTKAALPDNILGQIYAISSS